MEYNVFICYRGEGSGGMLASNIYSEASLQPNSKLKVFFAPKCIKFGQNFKEECIRVASQVSLVVLVLTAGFFDNCSKEDDVVYAELQSALSNQDTAFLPIIMPDFTFDNCKLSHLFNELDINRIKHISAIKYTDVYSFNTNEMLIPILKDKVGILDDVSERIERDLTDRRNVAKKRMHISEDGKKNYYSENNTDEIKRLSNQQQLLLNFDMPIYEKHLAGKKDMAVLDLGCSDGKALMVRLGNRPEVSKIIGIEYDEAAVNKANSIYSGTKARFYVGDIEANDFSTVLESIMAENGIEAFDWINILAVVSHLKSPLKVLKKLRKYTSPDATIFIRNIDDGLNLAYPDEKLLFERVFEMFSKCSTTGYRKSGRELYTILNRAGYKKIHIERIGLNSSDLDQEGKETLFDIIFTFLKGGLEASIKQDFNSRIVAERDWLMDKIDTIEEDFLSSDFFINFGFLIVVAKNEGAKC